MTSSNWSDTLRQYIQKWEAATLRGDLEDYWGDRPFENFISIEHVTTWDEYRAWVDELQGSWCFRGQRESSWPLYTSLDRAVFVEHSGANASGYFHLDRESEQRDLFLRFRERAPACIKDCPSADDLASWFALMQHHGVPTRLLDWTMSPDVAMYFALADESSEPHSAVWAIDLPWLRVTARQLLEPEEATPATDPTVSASNVNELLRYTDKPVVIPIEPSKLNERMIAQQGVLLCKLFHEQTFSQILMGMMIRTDVPQSTVIRKLMVDKRMRVDAIKRLRDLRIDGATLFRGIDGIGRSLKTDLEIKIREARAAAARERAAPWQ